MLYTSLLVQMWQGLAAAEVPGWARSQRAWRRSWLLGFVSAVVARVRAAEQGAAEQAVQERSGQRPGTQLVLADRAQVIQRALDHAYPTTRKSRMTYSGSGYSAGYAQGQRADLGGSRLTGHPSRAPGDGSR